MACYKPLTAYLTPWQINNSEAKDSKKVFRRVSFKEDADHSIQVSLPCGQCVGCRLERSRQWAVRCVHESQLHKENCFITLTYAPEHLPQNSSLDYRDFQLFMKRLRKRFTGKSIRFYMCGEYGENFGRPHFHACIFGHNFDDLKLWKTQNDVPLFRSKTLEELWPFGHSSVGTVTFESAAYVARYIMKKVTGDAAAEHYTFRQSFNRGDIESPPRIYTNVFKTRGRKKLAPKISH